MFSPGLPPRPDAGGLVMLDDKGMPQFHRLRARIARTRRPPPGEQRAYRLYSPTSSVLARLRLRTARSALPGGPEVMWTQRKACVAAAIARPASPPTMVPLIRMY